ncbi:MAG: hypothetical protein ABJA69_01055 [Acidobacteriaceae bacterium]
MGVVGVQPPPAAQPAASRVTGEKPITDGLDTAPVAASTKVALFPPPPPPGQFDGGLLVLAELGSQFGSSKGFTQRGATGTLGPPPPLVAFDGL